MELTKKMKYYYSIFLLLAIVNSHGAWGISLEEETDLENKLRILATPGLKSIRTDYGDVFDCVNIYRQPSLNHPLMEGHIIKMRPSSFPEPSMDDVPMRSESVEVGVKKGCPIGTVPIRRIPKKNQQRAKAFLKTYSEEQAEDNQSLGEQPGGYFKAEVQTRRKMTSRYYGAQAFLNVYNPKLNTKQQFSRMMMKLRYGNEDTSTSIEVGWAVFPGLYNDTLTRLHAFWRGDYEDRSCFDTICPGFVQVSSMITFGMKISRISNYLGNQYDIKLTVSRDPASGHWWLLYGWKNEPVGYWPKDLLGDLTITKGKWGGDVYSLFGPLPPMGSGFTFEQSRRSRTYRSACYIRGIRIQKRLGGEFLDVNGLDLEKKEDLPRCYNVGGQGISGNWGYTIYVGGYGGLCNW